MRIVFITAALLVLAGCASENGNVGARTPVTIVADRWCGLVTTLAMISVSAGYGIDGSSTPTIVAERAPLMSLASSWTVLPITAGSPLSTVLQKR